MARAGVITLGLTLLLSTACDEQQQSRSDLQDTTALLATENTAEPVEYTCEDGGRVQSRYESRHDRMVLFMTDRAAELRRVRSASGAKFEAQDIVFWSKGDSALLQRSGEPDLECHQMKTIAD